MGHPMQQEPCNGGFGKYGLRTAPKWLVPVFAEKFAAFLDDLNRLELEGIQVRTHRTGASQFLLRAARRSNERVIVDGI